MDFIFKFLEEREVEEYSLNQRTDDSWVTSPIVMSEEPRMMVTYHFIQFPASEIGFNAKDLTANELERDMKQMKKFING